MQRSGAFTDVHFITVLTGPVKEQSQSPGNLGHIRQFVLLHFRLSYGREEQNMSRNFLPGKKMTVTGKD